MRNFAVGTSRGICFAVALAAGAIAACSSRVDIAKDEQGATGDGGSTGGTSSGSGGAAPGTGGAVPETGGAQGTGGAPSPGTGGTSTGSGGEPAGSGGASDLPAAVACGAAPESGNCLAYMPRFYFDAATKTCKEFVYGGCGGNANNYQSIEECQDTCTKGNDPIAVIFAQSCAGRGEQISGPGTPDFAIQGSTVSREDSWGCGCATRPEFVMAYWPNNLKVELRLCHDDMADPCEAGCSQTLEYDLSGLPPHVIGDFVFPAP